MSRAIWLTTRSEISRSHSDLFPNVEIVAHALKTRCRRRRCRYVGRSHGRWERLETRGRRWGSDPGRTARSIRTPFFLSSVPVG